MMRLLLDTHVLLWWLADAPQLGGDARREIAAPRNLVYVSAVSLWEIVIKKSSGKLTLPDNWSEAVEAEPFRRLPVTWDHALGVGQLPAIHRDPFDRLLIAQATVEDLVLVTDDATVQSYGVATLSA